MPFSSPARVRHEERVGGGLPITGFTVSDTANKTACRAADRDPQSRALTAPQIA